MADRERLEDAITFLVAHAKSPLTRTALVKLLYFADLRSFERRGRSITGLPWIWHHFGPFSSEIYETLGSLESREEVTVDVRQTFYGNPEYRIHPGSAAGYYDVLGEVEEGILDEVAAEFGRIPPQRLAELSYYTAPMLDGKLHRGARLDFSSYSKPTQRPPAYKLDLSVEPPARMNSS
jgi:uncharacterized phage-associated protein